MIEPQVEDGRADGRAARPPEGPFGGGRPLVVRGLIKAYGRSRVLDVPELVIPPSTTTAVVGSNGAGKSTLLACLAGALIHGGSVSLGDVVLRPGRGRIGYLPQRIRLPSGATVGEVLALFRSLASPAPDRVVPPDGFLPPEHRRIGELSGGQAQRVALAATLLGSPEVLLLDEPLANLDDSGLAAVHAMLAVHRAAGATVLIASPVTAFDVLAGADLVIRLGGGRVTFRGTPSDFLGGLPTTVWVALGSGALIGQLAALDHVEQVRVVGSWAALGCRERDVTTLIRTLTDLGIAADQIRIAGPADRTPDPGPTPGEAGPIL